LGGLTSDLSLLHVGGQSYRRRLPFAGHPVYSGNSRPMVFVYVMTKPGGPMP
jgi:hypothetical protein